MPGMVSGTLVIQTAFLGDVVLTLPLIQRLAAEFGPVEVVVTPESLPLLAHEPAVARAIPYDKRGADRGLAGFRRLAAELRARRYARGFMPHRSLRSALLAHQAGIPERTGFKGGIAGLIHTHGVARPTAGHESARLLALAPGSAAPPPGPWLHLSDDDRQAAASWIATHQITKPFVVLAPGARWATKRWPGFPAFAAGLALPVIVIGGSDDRSVAAEIVQAGEGRARSAAGALTLLQSAALIERASLVVSNDSVALHLAGALDVPVLAVVGPTGPAPGFEPLPPRGQVIAHPDLACRPCSPHGHHRCPIGHHRCMRELAPAAVLAVARQRLSF